MRPAVWPREDRRRTRLLLLDPTTQALADRRVAELPDLLRPGDLLVVNDAATLPASLRGRAPTGEVELRLAAAGESDDRWTAVLFGPGDWRRRTEDRRAPVAVREGDALRFGGELSATVERVSSVSPRLVEVHFDASGDRLWPLLYRLGRPVQYSHLAGPLRLWHVQTAFSSRPWAVEAPSAGLPLGPGLARELRTRGIAVEPVTHAAGLSATGDPALDAALPLPERYEIKEPTVAAVERARARGGRVVAVGTTVVRALEGAAANGGGALRPGRGVTELRLGPGSKPCVVDAVLTGLHEPGTSHFELLKAFAPEPLLSSAWAHAEAAGYLGHEFGDTQLVLAA